MSSSSPFLDVPLPTKSSSPAWEALVATLTSKGVLSNSNNNDALPCETVADLMKQDSRHDDTADDAAPQHQHQQHPLLLVLVGGSWCAPCRNFTPVLKQCPILPNVKILFCSADHDDDSFQSYWKSMPASWSAVPYDENDAEDERDDLLEALNANSLPMLLVFCPVTGTLLEQRNAVHAVQASGSDGFVALVETWRAMALSGESSSSLTTSGATAAAGAVVVEEEEKKDDDDNDKTTLHYFIPAPPELICQYFKERLVSPDLPEALTSVILRRNAIGNNEAEDGDPAAHRLADAMVESNDDVDNNNNNTERWLFRTAAPALPMSWYGSSMLPEANAIECWIIERNANNDNNKNSNNNSIQKATCTIENETGRMILVFRETIVMEVSADGYGTNVTKTLNLNGVPSMGHGAFQRRWRNESELIFHALLGSCDRKKKSKGSS